MEFPFPQNFLLLEAVYHPALVCAGWSLGCLYLSAFSYSGAPVVWRLLSLELVSYLPLAIHIFCPCLFLYA